MSGRVGVDFGTSNSVVALWNESTESGLPLHIPDLGVNKRAGEQVMNVVPSLVSYVDEATTWYGGQVLSHNLYEDQQRTFRWMKRWISQRLAPIPRSPFDGRSVTPVEAATDFLATLLREALAEIAGDEEEVAFSVPVESFEYYEKWLRDVADTAGVQRFRLIDEASAAALGYGATIQPGDVYLVFDFGGGTLDVAVVRIEEDEGAAATGGRRCRVLGKQGADVGGSTIDKWLYAEILRRTGRNASDEDVRRLSTELLVRCEAAKEQLSSETAADVTAQDPATGKVIATEFDRAQFEDILDQHELFTSIDRVLSSAIKVAETRGFGDQDIKQVLLVGGSSLVPSVQKHVARRFGRDRVALDRPLVVVASGAAAFVAGVDFYDFIQHDYAVQHVNPTTGAYEYRTVVQAGTHYPSSEPIADIVVKAAWDGQEELGVAIYELANAQARGASQPMELVFDHSGAARLVEVTVDEQHARSHFWMNEKAPTFLRAEPPGRKGQERFRIQFDIDAGKRLLITAQDLKTKRWLYDRTPVIKLT